MSASSISGQQADFMQRLAARPVPIPPHWPKWLTDLWMRDLVTTEGARFVLTSRGRAQIEAPRPAEPHEILIIVGASHEAPAKRAKVEALAALQAAFPGTVFSMLLAEEDLVDGSHMVIPCRGKIGASGLRPMPPAELVAGVVAALERLRFLEAPALQ